MSQMKSMIWMRQDPMRTRMKMSVNTSMELGPI